MPSTSLNSRIVPAVLEWMFEQDDRVFVMYALDTYGSSLNPAPSVPLPVIDATLNGAGEPVQLKLLRLNISSESTSGFAMLDEGLSFKCRFSGKAVDVFVSYDSVVRLECPNSELSYDFPFILAKAETLTDQVQEKAAQEPKKSRANLTLVK